MDPLHPANRFSGFDAETVLKNTDAETANRYADLLNATPEPNWQDVAVKLITVLRQMRDKLLEMGENDAIRAPMIAMMIDWVLHDPNAGGDGVKFLEDAQKAIDIIILETMFRDDKPTA